MKAIRFTRYGVPDVLPLTDHPTPTAPDGGVLVRVRAAALNALDWYLFSGRPHAVRLAFGLTRPARAVPGVDFAGTVAAVGPNAVGFRVGDAIFGVGRGTLAEFVAVQAGKAAPIPTGVSFEQAAALPVAGSTALQGLRDFGRVAPGQRVLVIGAAGGVGSFAVQVARALGAEVTAVCSAVHAEQARALGAAHVVDYARADVTRQGLRYDLVFNVAGGQSWADFRRVLAPGGRVVMAGGPRTNPWFGPLGNFIALRLGSLGERKRFIAVVAKITPADLTTLAELVAAGTIRPVLDCSRTAWSSRTVGAPNTAMMPSPVNWFTVRP
jgi:NADPH:quinone reductase-like Zn-dependent oxidoreductase